MWPNNIEYIYRITWLVGRTLVFNSYEPYCNRPTETRSTHSLSKQFQQRDTVFDKTHSIYIFQQLFYT